jgi:hypothetical protein
VEALQATLVLHPAIAAEKRELRIFFTDFRTGQHRLYYSRRACNDSGVAAVSTVRFHKTWTPVIPSQRPADGLPDATESHSERADPVHGLTRLLTSLVRVARQQHQPFSTGQGLAAVLQQEIDRCKSGPAL